MYKVKTALAIVIFLYSVTCEQEKPGFILRISRSGLEYAASVAVDRLNQKIIDKPLPDKTGTTGSGALKLDYSLTNIKVARFDKPSSVVTLNEGSGLTWSLKNAGIDLRGNWRYSTGKKWYKIQDGGEFEAEVKGVDISVSVVMGSTNEATPTVQSTACETSIDFVKIKFSKGLNWINNIVNNLWQSPARGNLQSLLCKEARKSIDEDGNKELLKLNLTSNIDKYAILDYRLVAPPRFELQHVELLHRGRFYAITASNFSNDVVDTNITFRNFDTEERMINLYVSEEMLNSAASVLFKDNVLEYYLHRNKLPEEQKFILDIQCSGFLCASAVLPQATRDTLRDHSLSLLIRCVDAAPFFRLNPRSSMLSVTLNATFEATPVDSDLPATTLFSIKLSASVNVTASFDGERLVGKLYNFQTNILDLESQIGELNRPSLSAVIKLAGKVFVKQLNAEAKMGYEIPNLKRVIFENKVVKLLQGYIAVSADARLRQ